jgi:hypothetical protein
MRESFRGILSPVFLRPQEWEKVPEGRMRVAGIETNPVERAGVRTGFLLAHIHLPAHGA